MTGRISDVSIAVKWRRAWRGTAGIQRRRRRHRAPRAAIVSREFQGRGRKVPTPADTHAGVASVPSGPPNEINNRISSIPISQRGVIYRPRRPPELAYLPVLAVTGPRTVSHPRDPSPRKPMLYPPADLRRR